MDDLIPKTTVCLVFLLLLVLYSEATVQRVFSVTESVSVGTTVGYLGESRDASGAPNYLIVYPPESEVEETFSVNEQTGQIKTIKALDYEFRTSYVFLAIPFDGSQGIRVTVNVVDVNDNKPEFPVKTIDIQLSEYAKIHSEQPLPSAMDKDSSQFSVRNYRIVSGNVNNAFRLSMRKLNDVLYVDLVVNAELDREYRESYQLLIEALDGGDPPQKDSLLVNVTVIDGNDNSPQFTQPRYQAQLFHNASIGDGVIQVEATDKDIGVNSELEYRLLPSPLEANHRFSIDSNTGLISVARSLSIDNIRTYELLVAAKDKGLQPLESTAFVTITVVNARQNVPLIKVLYLSADGLPHVKESANIGDLIARVSVTDPDTRGDYTTPVNVSLSGQARHFFDIQNTGISAYVITLARPLDREIQAQHRLSLFAADKKGRFAEKNVTLDVDDVNDNAPRFSRANFEAEVSESAGTSASVFQISATDADVGENGRISYSFVENSPYRDWFQIDPATGLITTSSEAVDCEVSSQPTLTVMAKDGGKPALSSSAKITIRVLDVNDNAPIFEKPIYNITVPEDTEIGSCFLQLRATDPDCGLNAVVRYSIPVDVPERSLFRLDAASGKLCLEKRLDYETRKFLQFSVLASDGGGLTSEAFVQLQVEDRDDNAPVFYPAAYNVSVRRDVAPGSPLLVVSATDADSGAFGKLTYRIHSGDGRSLFRIDRNTGDLYVEGLLQARNYHLTVQAIDGGGLSTVQPAQIIIIVQDINDYNAPTFDQKLYKFTVREDTLPGIAVGKVQAFGGANLGPVTYGIYSGDPEGYFTINPQSGTISVQKYLDTERQSSVLLNIQASLGNPPTYNHTQVRVEVQDVNDNAPDFETSLVKTSLAENHETSAPFYIVQATDRDQNENGRITYKLVKSSPPGPFLVKPHSGELSLTAPLDYEIVKFYRLMVRAEDGGIPSRGRNMSVEIDVLDINDNPPVFTQKSYRADVVEDAEILSKIIQVNATDKDTKRNAKISYTLQDSANDMFGIFSDGWLYVRKNLDRETRPQYDVTVVAKDAGKPPLSSTAQVTIRLLDVNDNAPKCTERTNFSVPENSPANTWVGRVQASDPDNGANGSVFFQLLDKFSMFRIDSTGSLYTTRPFDAEVQLAYHMDVVVQDNAVPSKSSECLIVVEIEDVNDNPPFFVLPHQNRILFREEQPIGTEVVQVRATDPDQGLNGTIRYKFATAAMAVPFSIDPETGVITANSVLDFESLPSPLFPLKIRAEDLGTPRQWSEKDLTVELVDVDDGSADNQGRVSTVENSISFEVSESALIGTIVGSVDPKRAARFRENQGRLPSEEDLDISYTIVSGNSQAAFDIDRLSSVLYLVKQLDFETLTVHILKISRQDLSRPGLPVSTIIEVRIRVLDENDNGPTFPEDPVICTVPENAPLSHVVWRYAARDADAGANGRLVYQIVQQSPEAVFQLESVTGELWLEKQLDHERFGEYIVVVEASDQATDRNRRNTARVTTRIYVTDVNDNRPQFRSEARVDVFEDEPPIIPFFYVVAEDRDWLDNGRVTYSLEDETLAEYFSLNGSSGALSLNRRLGRDSPRQFQLTVLATDHGRPQLSATQQLSVFVMNAKANAPRFLQPLYRAPVVENAPAGTFVVQLQAEDTAGNGAGALVFALPKDSRDGLFYVEETTGVLKTRQSLDREKQPEHIFTVLVRDARHPTRYDAATVVVEVEDLNDNAPLIPPTSCLPLSIPENRALDSFHSFLAFDVDSSYNARLSYRITAFASAGNVDDKFTVNPSTGALSCKPLDRETIAEYTLTISVKDGGNPTLESSCLLPIQILDVNDETPHFQQPSYTADLPEDTVPGTTVIQLVANDRDPGPNGQITYSLVNETTGLFEIHAQTGTVVTVGQLDYETKSLYTLAVRASDGGVAQPKASETRVTIRVTDVNDHAPAFSATPFVANVSTQIRSGQRVVVVTATDGDSPGRNSELIYSFTQQPHEFTINPSTGVISARRDLFFQAGSIYFLAIRVEDQGQPTKSSTGIVEIRVQPTNDNGRPFKFPKDLYHAKLEENAARGTEVLVCQVESTVSVDLQYRIVHGNEDDAFGIEAWSGKIYVSNARLMDFERSPTFRLIVEASSSAAQALPTLAGQSYQAFTTVRVQLIDVNDQQPQFLQQRYSTAVREGNVKGTYVIQTFTTVRVQLIDVKDQQPRFLQQRYSTAVREVNVKGTYVILTISTIRVQLIVVNDQQPQFLQQRYSTAVREENVKGTYVIQTFSAIRVQLIDVNDQQPKFLQQRFSTAVREGNVKGTYVIQVQLIDVNVQQPQFLQQRYSTAVREGNVKGTYVIQVSAMDGDSGENAHITYSIVRGNVDSAFAVDARGALRTNARLDREINHHYSLTVMATDAGAPPLSGTAVVDIHVIDVNDNKPSFPPPGTVRITEATDPGSLIANIRANDVDAESLLEYRFKPGQNLDGQFSLDQFSGRLCLSRPLDYEKQQRYLLKIEAFDGVHTDETNLTVLVLDANDNKPEFDQKFYQVSLPEDTPGEVSIMQIQASDRDSGENGRIRYRLVGNVPYPPGFWIDGFTGSLYTNATLGRGARLLQLMVAAEDGGNPRLTAFAPVQVQIVSRTEQSQPKFDKDVYRFSVAENALRHTAIGTLSVALLERYSDLVFVFKSGNEKEMFHINSAGNITLTRLLDREETAEYILVVAVFTKRNSVVNSTATVQITVQDVNDNAPQFEKKELNVRIGESTAVGAIVAQLTATDADAGENGRVSYEITSGNKHSHFSLDTTSGILKVAKALNSRLPAGKLVVRASDYGEPPKSSIATVNVHIQDENNNGPFFPVPLFLSRIPENSPSGTPVFTARATDKDGGDYGKLTYTLKSEPGEKVGAVGKFWINKLTGEVRTIDLFDYEDKASYSFIIEAADSGGRSASVPGQVLIKGVDEYAPAFVHKNFVFRVSFDVAVNENVGVIYATDRDGGIDGQIKYSLKEESNYFAINSATGVITVLQSLKHLAPPKHKNRVKRLATQGDDDSSDVQESTYKTIFLTVIAKSTTKANSTSVELQLGYFAKPELQSSFLDSKLITIISIVLVLLLVLVLLFIALKLRRKKVKRHGSTPKVTEYPRKEKCAPYHSNANGHSTCSTIAPYMAAPVISVTNSDGYESSTIVGFNNIPSHHHSVKKSQTSGPTPVPMPCIGKGRKPLSSVSNLSTKSSGHGSVFGDDQEIDDDEEVLQLTSRANVCRSQQMLSMPDSGIHVFQDDTESVTSDLPSAQEYLTNLGVTEPTSSHVQGPTAHHNIDKVVENGRVEAIELVDPQDNEEIDVQELIYSKVNEVLAEDGEVAGTSRQLADVRSVCKSPAFSPIHPPADTDFTSSAVWRPGSNGNQSWGPAYQPLTQVFSEISKLKGDQSDTLKRNHSSNKQGTPIRYGPPTPTKLPLFSAPNTSGGYQTPNSTVRSPSSWLPTFSSPTSSNGNLPARHYSKASTSEFSESEVDIKI